MDNPAFGSTAPDFAEPASLDTHRRRSEQRERLRRGIAADREQLVDFLRGVRSDLPNSVTSGSGRTADRHITLIEDNSVDAKLTKGLLKRSGLGELDIAWFTSIADASAHVRDSETDLIMLDLGLPDGDGPEVVQRIRMLTATTPIVVLSGQSDEKRAIASLHEGAQDYVVKGTIDAPTLGRTVRLALARAETERSLRLSLVKLLVRSDQLSAEVERRIEIEDQLLNEQERLSEVIAQLELASEAKTEFLATVSHELRTPLTSILGYTEILSEDPIIEGSDAAEEALRIVSKNGRRLLSMVENLLTTAEVDSTNGSSKRELVDVGALVASVLEMLQPAANTKHQRLSALVEDGVPHVWADVSQLERALLNVVGNALKFTPQAGVIRVSAYSADQAGSVQIVVTDNGPGIAEDELENLCDPFLRGAEAIANEVPGTGLGLGIAESIVRSHRGEMTISSEHGRGTKVSLIVPVDPRVGQLSPSSNQPDNAHLLGAAAR